MTSLSDQIIFPLVYAKNYLEPKLLDPNFFNQSELPETLSSSISLLFSNKTTSNSSQILSQILSSSISNEVKKLISTYIDLLTHSDLLLSLSGNSIQIVEILDRINLKNFNKETFTAYPYH